MSELGKQSQLGIHTRNVQSGVAVTEPGYDLRHPHDDFRLGQFANVYFQIIDGCVEVGFRQDMKRLEVRGPYRCRKLLQILSPMLAGHSPAFGRSVRRQREDEQK